MKEIKLEKSTHSLLENGIIKVVIKDGAEIQIAEMEAIRAANLDLSDGRKCVVFVDPGKRFNVSKEARALTASKEHSQYRKAQAFLARSLAEKLVGNFYIKVQKPNHPTKMFMDEEPALKWLEQFL